MDLGAGSSNVGFLGSCHYNDELYMVSINNPINLMGLFFTLSRKCNDIRPKLISLQFQAPHDKILVTLNDDDDVSIMLHLHTCMKLRIIEERAVRRNDSSRDNRHYESCGEDNWHSWGHRADSSWVANIVKDKLRAEPLYRPCAMIKDIHREYGIELEYHKAWMGKELVMHDIHGTDKGAYGRLQWYCSGVKDTNPGSVADCEIDNASQKFQRLFICLNVCALGFVNGCGPLLFLDGTHNKNKYKGCILADVIKDANNELFTLAYAVVDTKNDINWPWFSFKLRSILLCNNIMVFNKFTFFSDRHPGIISAIESVFPSSHHAYCVSDTWSIIL